MGKVYLVGAGPGAADLLTVRALRLIQQADVILFDALVGTEILQFASSKARLINVGNRSGRKSFAQEDINALLIYSARTANTVVRLKGGDPMIFGRAAEEIVVLRQAGIDFEIVPGITAACSAAAATGISLTDRHVSSKVSFLTAHSSEENAGKRWIEKSDSDRTLVIYMPGRDYERISSDLLEAGVVARTPCAVVSRISSPDQMVLKTTVSRLASESALPSPALLIVGEVVNSAPDSTSPTFNHAVEGVVRSYVAYVAR